MTGAAGTHASNGRRAETPTQFPPRAWLEILGRVWTAIQHDRVLLIAAGATFYLLLALFPALAAFVSLYGFVADPRTIADHIAWLGGLLPQGGVELIESQLEALIDQDVERLSFGFLSGLAVALWSANNGVKTLFEAMNVANQEDEKRGFIRLNLLSALFTLGAMGIAASLIFAVGVVPAALALLQIDGWTETIVRYARWPVLLVCIWLAISLVYRFGPSREPAKWRWLNWGAALATIVWVATSAGFSFYLQNFADYNAAYGSLGAVVGFMVWIWISVAILIVGAEINAEMERQTERDTTTGPELPMGERGAVVADTVVGGE